MNEKPTNKTRREFFSDGLRGTGLLGLGSVVGLLAAQSRSQSTLWQIDPYKCISCGRCATECVMTESAVKCVHAFAMCGYCDLCTGYLVPDPGKLDTGAEYELCPTGAIQRNFVEDPYYEYNIDETLCNGCAKCVKGCEAFGNGSFYLQVRHDRCVNCNECAIAAACPSNAFKRVPVDQPYLLKEVESIE